MIVYQVGDLVQAMASHQGLTQGAVYVVTAIDDHVPTDPTDPRRAYVYSVRLRDGSEDDAVLVVRNGHVVLKKWRGP